MKCLKCGTEIDKDSKFCITCGAETIPRSEKDLEVAEIPIKSKNLGISIIVMGIVALIFMFVASFQIHAAAGDMLDLRSQSGTSVDEAFYQYVGGAMKGFATFIQGLGIAILTFSVGIGYKYTKA